LSTTATAFASSRECVIDRSIEPAPTRSAHGRDSAAEAHRGLRPAGDLDITPGERARDAEPERLPYGFLAGEPAGIALGRIRARVAIRALGLREAALAEARITLERAAHALDLDQVDTDGHK